MKNRINLSKTRIIIIGIEAMLLMAVVIALFVGNRSYTVDIYNEDNSCVKLTAGRYLVTVEYEEQDDNLFLWLSDLSGKWQSGSLFTEPQLLRHSSDSMTYEVWVTGFSENVKFNLNYMTENTGIISSITVKQTRFVRICIGLVLFAVFAVTMFVFAVKDGKIRFTRKNAVVALCVAGIAVIASLPLFTPYLPVGFDSYFHITRIEGVKDGLYSGQFPVRVEPTYLNGYGYAVSTFYGGLFFYAAALFRIIGFSLQTSYKLLLFFINLITATGSYFFFKEVFRKEKWGIAGAVLFTLSAYKFCNTYYRGAVAESIAMAFVPIVALCLWNIYNKPYDKHYSIRFIPLTLAFSCVLESHLIGTEIVGATAAAVCLVLFRKTFRRETLLVFIKFVIATLLLNAFFLVPFADSLSNMKIAVNSWENVKLAFQNTGIALKDLFIFEIPEFDTEKWYYQEYTITVGTAFLPGIIITLAAAFCGGMKRENRKSFLLWTISGLLFLFMVTVYFPWDRIISFCYGRLGKIGLALTNMISNMQYSYRLLIVCVLFLTGMTVNALILVERRLKRVSDIAAVLLGVIAVSQCVLLESSVIATEYNSKEQVVAITEHTGDSTVTGNGEYFPLLDDGSLTYMNVFDLREAVLTNAMQTDYHKEGTNISIEVVNNTEYTGMVELPLLYYFGYGAKDSVTGREVMLFPSSRKHLAFSIEPGKTMDVRISYVGKTLWRAAEVLSAITFIVLISMVIADFFERKKKIKEIS